MKGMKMKGADKLAAATQHLNYQAKLFFISVNTYIASFQKGYLLYLKMFELMLFRI